MFHILLSIVIPTYNRKNYLKENLANILQQAKPYKEQIQIVVSDNASYEDFTSMIASLVKEFDVPIDFYRQEKNLGMNGNAQFVNSKAQGKYVLFMGDDDLLSPNFLSIIMPYLAEEKKYALIHWNRLCGDANCSNNKLWDSRYDKMVQELSMTEFIYRTDDAPNFMSSVLYLRECWSLGLSHVRESADGYRWFCIVYWGAALLKLPCVYYYMPLVIQRNPSRSYITKFPYYIIVEMSDLFLDLDAELPGVHAFWQQHLRRKWMWTLPGMTEDRPFYRKHEAEFLPYLTSKEQHWMEIWLYAPGATFIKKIYRRFHKRPK